MDEARRLEGVTTILATPFRPDGAVDDASLRRLVGAAIGAGADAVTALGVAGEAGRLTETERAGVLATVAEAAAGRVPVVAGVSQDGTDTTIAAAALAERAGAAAVMVAPPAFLQPGAALTEHFRRVAAAIGVPIVLQDFPPVNGVTMSPDAMAALARAVPAITTVKLEGVPTPQRVGQTVRLLGGRAAVVGGLGGMYLLDELRRGAAGTMTGFAYPEVLVEIWRAWRAGDRAGAAAAYARALPLLVFEGQTGVGLAIRKAILRRRGLIDHDGVRHPGPVLDQGLRDDLDETLALLDVEQRFDGAPAGAVRA